MRSSSSMGASPGFRRPRFPGRPVSRLIVALVLLLAAAAASALGAGRAFFHAPAPMAADTVAVFGPKRFAAGGGVPQLHVERFRADALPGARHVLRVSSAGATAAELKVNGVVVVSRTEFGRAGGALSRELALQGEVTLQATVEGATGTGVVVSVVREPNPTFVVYDEHRFARDASTPVVETARFVVPPSAGAPVTLHVRNGNADGTARVTSAVVRINGTQVFGGDDFNPEIGYLARVFVPRAGENVVEFALKGQPGTFLSVWVTATDVTAPALEIASPAPGLVTNRAAIEASGRVLDQTLTRVTVDGEPAARQGDTFTATVALPNEGENTIRFSAVDAAGNRTDSVRTVVRDTEAPVVTLQSPADGLVTKLPSVTVRGTVTDRAGVTASVNGVPVTPDATGAFAVDVPLAEGLNYIALTATDAAGNATSVARQVTLDTQAPVISITEPAEGAETGDDTVAVRGSVSDATAARVEIDGAEVQVTPTGTFGGAVALQVGANTITVTATDAAGNVATATRSVTRRQAGPPLPPDPAKVAPAVDPTVPTTLAAATAFLYTGANPVQTGVAPGTIQPVRAAVVRGRVLDRDGAPLSGVTVSILGHPELGQTLSRADGAFDLAVNGGGLLFVEYRKDGYLPSQRRVNVPWRDYVRAEDVALAALDPVVTRIEMDPAGGEAQVARASVVSDDDGTRRATLVFQPGTEAVLEMPDGTTRPLGSIAVRATELTVGEGGLRAMPGTLPPTTAYTYAAELSADEAIAAGAEHVRFSKPVPFYLENFLDLPAGMSLPLGVYDPECGCWIPEPDGRVVQVVSVASGVAELDVDGDGAADGAAALAALGVTDAERARLATLYTAGQRLWRVPMRHFSAVDINLPEEPQCGPGQVQKPGGGCGDAPPKPPEKKDKKPDDPCKKKGSSWIECESQVLGESFPVAGTPFSLVYSSGRVPGRAIGRTIAVPLTGAEVSPGLKRVELTVDVAGRRITRAFPAAPNQSADVEWDGLDAYGRPVQGAQAATVQIGYVYDGVYQVPPARAASFGLPSGVPGTIPTRRETVQTRVALLEVGSVGSAAQGVGGWSLDVHHVYDPTARVLHRGDGSQASAQAVRSSVSRVAGSGFQGSAGDGGAATTATLSFPRKIAFGPDGSLYIADNSNARVRRVTPDGRMTTFAGGGATFADGLPATQVRLSGPSGVAVGPDGSVYIADSGARKVFRVGPDGVLTTIAGTGGSGYSGDGGPAKQATLVAPHAIAVGPDCSVYIAEITGYRIRRIGPDGIITTVAGTGLQGESGDGGPATQARIGLPLSVGVTPEGVLYFSDYQGSFQPGRVRRVGLDGIITTLAGGGSQTPADGVDATSAILYVPGHATLAPDGTLFVLEQGGGFTGFPGNRIWRVGTDGKLSRYAGNDTFCRYFAGTQTCGDGEAPRRAAVSEPYAMAVGPDGALYVTERSNHLVRRIAPTLPGFSGGTLLLASAGGDELYETDLAGRHLRTLDALTGAVRYTFGYDAAGRLVRVTDGDGNATTVERASDGSPAAIVAPDGQRTVLGVSPEGYLARVENPAGEAYAMVYGAGGLLTAVTTPRGHGSRYVHDARGLLVRAEDDAGGSRAVGRADDADGVSGSVVTGAGVSTGYRWETLADGGTRRVSTGADGLSTVTEQAPDGTLAARVADGTRLTVRRSGDPRFGMQAPVVSEAVFQTPAGLTATLGSGRRTVLANAADPLSVTAQVDSLVVNGRVWRSSYDAATRAVTTRSPEGRTVVALLDAQRRPLEVRRPGLAPLTRGYDARGRLVSQGEGGRTTTLGYDARGRVERMTDPAGRVTRLFYDDADRLVRQQLPGGREVEIGYDAAGNVVRVTPAGRSAHTFGYDAVNLPEHQTAPAVGGEPASTRFAYDADRRLTTVTRADGRSVGYGYDAAGRVATVSLPGGALAFAYDPATGAPASITSPGGDRLSFAYDGSLPVSARWEGAVRGRVSVAYDADFRVASDSVNGAHAAAYQYDRDGLLVGAGGLAIARDAQNGRMTGTTLGGVASTAGYAPNGDPASLAYAQGAAQLFGATYTRDDLGRIATLTETVQGAATVWGYGYDAAGRLETVTRDGAPYAAYEYDANGNRLRATGPAGAVTGVYDAQDRLLSYGGATYAYTAAGDLRAKAVGGDTTRYDYDVLGSLRAVELPGGRRIEYVIDGMGRRTGKKVDGALAKGWLYQGTLAPVAELDGAGQVTARFVYGTRANVPDYMVRGGRSYRLVTDHLGSVRLVVDAASGAVAQRIDYDPWGRVILDTSPGFQPFGFAGGMYEAETGLVRFGARDYDPETGRWTTRDPLGFGGGDTNLYGYVLNDPVNWSDPAGTFSPTLASAAISAVIAGVQSYLSGASWGEIGKAVTVGFIGGLIPGSILNGIVSNVLAQMILGGAASGALGNMISQFLQCGSINDLNAILRSAVSGAIGSMAGVKISGDLFFKGAIGEVLWDYVESMVGAAVAGFTDALMSKLSQ